MPLMELSRTRSFNPARASSRGGQGTAQHFPLQPTHHLHELSSNLRLELRPRTLFHIPQHTLGLPGRAIRTVRTQRIVHVAYVNELARLVAVAVVVAARIALAVDHD